MELVTLEDMIFKAKKFDLPSSKDRSKKFQPKETGKFCYFCKNPWEIGHKCKEKEKRDQMNELKRKNLYFKFKEPGGHNHTCKRENHIHNLEEEHPNKRTRGEEVIGSIATISQENEN